MWCTEVSVGTFLQWNVTLPRLGDVLTCVVLPLRV
jgi:hypothetical protein